ncbi:unnamed protein product, partial [Porites lobata]
MEQEITGREILRCTWKMLEGKANNLVNGIQSRSDKLDKSTSCPLSEQTNFDSSIENKVADFKRLVDIFLFGGGSIPPLTLHQMHHKRPFEWKDKASKMRDVSLHEELVGYFNDATAFKTFLAYELPEITEAVRMKATIKERIQFGLAGQRSRWRKNEGKCEKRKRDEKNVGDGRRKTAFVPLVKTFLRVRGEIDKKQNDSIDGKSEGEGEGEGDDYGIKEDTCNEVGKEIISDDDMLEKSHEQDEEEEKVEEKDEQDEEEEKVEEEEYEQDEEEEKVEEEDEQKEEEEKV